MPRVLITGAQGMLGTALCSSAPTYLHVSGIDLVDGDLANDGVAKDLLARYQADVVIHCAAWTDVDGCTREPERALRHNEHATALLAQACAARGNRLIYLSTDYVFAGDGGHGYYETDTPSPINVYGASKLAGERAISATVANHVIARTQWLYGPNGRNFVATIVQAARTRDELKVVANEFGSPTYTLDLAVALWQLVISDVTGILHLTNRGVCSWFHLAQTAIRIAGLNTRVRPIASAEWGSITRRPQYSPLCNERWGNLGWPLLRPWQEAVTAYVKAYLHE